MNENERNQVIYNLNQVANELRHMEFREDRDRAQMQDMREKILQALKLIYEQENIIKALMGDYDSCDTCNSTV